MTAQSEPSEAMIEAAMEAYYSAADGSPPSRLGIVAALKEATRTDSPAKVVKCPLCHSEADHMSDRWLCLCGWSRECTFVSTDSPTDAVEAKAREIAKRHGLDPDAISPKAAKAGHSIPEWYFFGPEAIAELIALPPSGKVSEPDSKEGE